jgi:hypothetical protein
MSRPPVTCVCCRACALGFALVALLAGARAEGPLDEWPVTREQIEEDWLRQYEVLESKSGTPLQASAVTGVVQRARSLSDTLQASGVDVSAQSTALHEVQRELDLLGDRLATRRARDLYLRARWLARELTWLNPELDFESLVFVQRAPGSYPHMADQYCGWFSRPGGGLYILDGWKQSVQRRRLLTGSLPAGSVLRPDLSYDGSRVLFAYCRHVPGLAERTNKLDKESIPEDAFYHLYEIQTDGTGLRRLTSGRYDHFDGRYLPNGQIVFVSTRRGQSIQCLTHAPQHAETPARPDSFMRCGGSLRRPVPVCTLHVMDHDGRNVRCLSPGEGFDWNPTVAEDGRIIFSRWDYVDRDSLPYVSLWSTLPDGSAPQAVFGNFTANPLAMLEPRQVPGSQDFLFTAAAQHAITGGSLVAVDPRLGRDVPAALRRLTPQVPWPESEAWPASYFAAACPLSARLQLVAWSNQRLVSEFEHNAALNNPPNATGIYLLDAFGNLELIHRDGNVSSTDAIPLRARRCSPHAVPIKHNGASTEGRLLLLDVQQGLDSVTPGTIRSLRIVGVLPKTQPVMNFPPLGVTEEDAGKFVLGTVPVAADGSAYFRLPAGVPVFFQALDKQGMAVQTMRSVTYVQAGTTYSCVGCHEHRGTAPPNRATAATSHAPDRITPGPTGTWPFDFDTLVQPVLDQQCVRCHKPGTEGAEWDLSPGTAYSTLIAYGTRNTLQGNVLKRYAAGRSLPGTEGARQSPLTRLLQRPHYDVALTAGDWERIITWMDLYSQRSGSFSSQQETELRDRRQQWSPLLTATGTQ